ncbi:SDR family NAD(P)-dependent oxidoreductase [Pedobacter metabolipauper]|uniref:NAD(P)-dependent dehydrogenase (Short-subunit alcohol dehydrogenase family) n=1 Tax=Pedobacter metabolipauper TaxID=425513 RepID=A0A4R6SXQ0_9SPHI|nr:SDR family NAD(P)-dependent oxidoreductase [Pedobacter metabolipauper]TDQ10229.1 NAD(P)-dependent dehydrogenase (short-subunit alcohol dehydrogenase family) [Pedobacter metabolipauper]
MEHINEHSVLQKPINSGFNAASTSTEVIKGIDLTGKIAIVTGGYAGLGLETVKTFSEAGATVIVPARDTEKAKKNLQGIANVEIKEMDLINPASVDNFASEFLATERPLHILVLSAGIMALPELTLDDRGYEYHFATNHLGHFQLSVRLWDALKKANGARVVSVSAWAHRQSEVIFDDPHFTNREYQPMLGYGQSKTANILLSVGIDKRGKSDNIRAFSLHPGSIVSTELGRNFSKEQLQAFGVIDAEGNPVIDPFKQLKTVEQGASTQVWCATNPKLNEIGGVYCENTEVANVVDTSKGINWASDDSTRQLGVMPYAIDPHNADRLWNLSEELTGVKFDL